MTTLPKSKNPARDHRKAVLAVLRKYFIFDMARLPLTARAMRPHWIAGDSPAYVAISLGKAYRLPLACPRPQRGRR